MNRIACTVWALSLVVACGCAATPDDRKVLHGEARPALEARKEQNETQIRLIRLLTKLENLLKESEKAAPPENESKPPFETEISNRLESQDKKLIELKATQESLLSSLEAVMQSKKEILQKIEKMEQKHLELEKRFRLTNGRDGAGTGKSRHVIDGEDREDDFSNSAESPDSLSPEELYEKARQAFGEQRYKAALGLWSKMTKRFPNHELAPNAYFWQGESCYQLQDFSNAELNFDEVVKNYPESDKYPTALLKGGLSCFAMNKYDEGRVLLKELIDKFPNGPEARRAEIFLRGK